MISRRLVSDPRPPPAALTSSRASYRRLVVAVSPSDTRYVHLWSNISQLSERWTQISPYTLRGWWATSHRSRYACAHAERPWCSVLARCSVMWWRCFPRTADTVTPERYRAASSRLRGADRRFPFAWTNGPRNTCSDTHTQNTAWLGRTSASVNGWRCACD